MATVRDHFEREAETCLDRLTEQISAPTPDIAELRRLSRTLRGEAQMAREDRVQEVVTSLESAVRAFSAGSLSWSGDVRERATRTVEDIRALIAAAETPAELEDRVARAIERWREVGIEPALSGAAGTADAGSASSSLDEFSRFALVELGAIISELDAALHRFEAEPRAREPIAAVLRRQRALLGAAHLERLGPAAGALRMLDEVGRSAIAPGSRDPDAELRAFLQAVRDALSAALAALGRGDRPSTAPVYDRLADARRRVLPPGTAALSAERDSEAAEEEDFPVEVLNFFRSESTSILRHLDRIAAELTGAAPEEIAQLRGDARGALSSLRDTAHTFGFHSVGRTASELLARSGHIAAGELHHFVDELRREIDDASRVAEDPQVLSGWRHHARSATIAADLPSDGPDLEVAVAATGEDAIPIEALLYRGDRALQRALDLRPDLEAAVSDEAARHLLEELFALIRLARS